MILSQYLLGFIEDNIGFFNSATMFNNISGCSDSLGYPTGTCWNLLSNNQPIFSLISFVSGKLLPPVLAYNLLLVSIILLNFVFSFMLFKRIFSKGIALLLSVVFSFSPYMAYQGRSHLDLLQFWTVIMYLYILFFSKSSHKPVYAGLALTLVTGISNYLAYFAVLFTALYFIISWILSREKTALIKRNASGVLKGLGIFLISSLIFAAPYIKSNFLSPKVRPENSGDIEAVNRPFEDFVTFSSRLWYYLLPSVDNPFYGGFSQKMLDQLSLSGNYLTQNYFKSEHSASYLGWTNILMAIVGVVYLKKKKSEHPIRIKPILFTILVLILLTMPPSVTVSGVTVYLPSYLLFKAFPMFRVLSRMGVLILFLTLIFTGYGYHAIYRFLTDKKLKPGYIKSVLALIAFLSLTEFFIPLKITRVNPPPQVYAYIYKTDRLKSPLVVYPYNKTNEALFWMQVHSQPLINPRDYVNKETGFVSDTFTSELTTDTGLEKARNLGAKYLVYFNRTDENKNSQFFNGNQLLVKVQDFKESSPDEQKLSLFGWTLVRVVEAGTTASNSASLYKFR